MKNSNILEDGQPMEALAQATPISEVDSQHVENPWTCTFTFKIENFSLLNTTKHYSDVFVAGGYKWRLLIFPKGNKVDHLSIYLDVADSVYLPSGWGRSACFCISVVNQAHVKYTIRKKTRHLFNARESDWGFTSFMALNELHDPSKGFIVNDTIVVDVVVAVSQHFTSSSMSHAKEKTTSSSESIMPTIPTEKRSKTDKAKIVENEPVPADSKPSSGTHTVAASLGVTIPDDDELNDLNFSDEESSHRPVAPAKSIDDLPPLSKKVEAARNLILSILNKKSLYTIAEDLQLFTDALKTIKVAASPAQAERLDKMLKLLPESAHQLEAANKHFHEAKAILDEHEELDVAVKTDIDAAKRMKADQQAKTTKANKLVSDIVAKEAELSKLKQVLGEMGDIKKGNVAVRKAYDDCLNKKKALQVLSAKVADAEAKKKAAGEEANKVLQEWEAYVQENEEFI